MTTPNPARRKYTPAEATAEAAQIEAAFAAMGHPLDDDIIDRARRLLAGEITHDEAVSEIFAELEEEVRADEAGGASRS